MKKMYSIIAGKKRVARNKLDFFLNRIRTRGMKLREQETDFSQVLWDAKSGFKRRQTLERKSTDSY